MLYIYQYKGRLCPTYNKNIIYDADEEEWITLKSGAHVKLDEEGKVVGGAGGALNGTHIISPKAKSTEKTDFSPKSDNDGNEVVPIKAATTFDYDTVVSSNEPLKKVTSDLSAKGIEYNEPKVKSKPMTENEIIKEIAQDDNTDGDGSCTSACFAYIGQKYGLDVNDFRGGESTSGIADNGRDIVNICSNNGCLQNMLTSEPLRTALATLDRITDTSKEYCFNAGGHTAIVRKNKQTGELQYLELQNKSNRGWHDFGKDRSETLVKRFGCVRKMDKYSHSFLVEIDKLQNDKFRAVLGYLHKPKKEG